MTATCLGREARARRRLAQRELGRPDGVQSGVQIAVNRRAHEQEFSDAELVRRAQGGVSTAFAELVTRYQDRVFNTCYRMCHNHADALDLTQSTFLRALENLTAFEGRSSFYTWLFRIAVNLTMTHRRKKLRRPAQSLDQADGDQRCGPEPVSSEDDDAVSRPAEQRELQVRVEWALAQLDYEFRAAVVLKDIEGMDYASIAEVLDVAVGTVKSRIHRGRAVLRDLLAERKTVDQA